MNRRIIFCYLVIISTMLLISCSDRKQQKVIAEFNNIKTTPEVISFTNEFEINNSGGHIQGIQQFKNKQEKYVFMSGSSDSCSYCAVVKLGVENKVISVNRLMDKPYKHAGGFQVFQNYMAVGIEDNTLKDKSKVCIYDVYKPENHFANPIAIIERNGEPLRSTAGCVAMTNYKNGILLAVGDWDTKHIDFYSTEFDKMVENGFKKIGTVDTENISQTNWINNEWHSYQNINLFNIKSQLYLIGLGQNRQSENIADLFEFVEKPPGTFTFKKVASKTLACTNECSFKAAAGVEYDNGEFTLLASGYNIDTTSYLNVFSSK